MSNQRTESKFFPENPTQDTSTSNHNVDKIFDLILDEIEPVDFALLASNNRNSILNTLLETTELENEGDESTLTYQDVLSAVTDQQSQANLDEKVYKLLVVRQLLKFAENIGYPLADFRAETWVYSGKHWIPCSKQQLQDLIAKASSKMGVPFKTADDIDFASRCARQIQLTGYRPEYSVDKTTLNFQNGTLHVDEVGNFEFLDHSPDDLICYVLPYNYDPEASSPMFDAYLERVLPDQEKQAVIAEFIASCFTKHKHEKALILYGTGSNGKSVLHDTTTEALGADNVCSHTLEDLTDVKGYHRGQLGDHLLNFSGEISTKLNADGFKKLASREKISARYPYGRPFEITNYARLAFNCNELPEAEDTSEGYYRRFLIIEFDQYIRKEERDINLARKIVESELPGVMNWILEGLKRLTKQNGFSPCKAAELKLDWYKKHADTVATYVESDAFTALPDEIQATDLHADYELFCEENGYHAVGIKTFSFRLQKCGLKKKRRADAMYYCK